MTILAATMFLLLILSSLITPSRSYTAMHNIADERSSSNIDSLSNQVDQILSSGKLVFLYFYEENCYACRLQKPLIEELEREYSNDVVFIRVNGLENREAMAEFNVLGFPTMFLISGKNVEGYEHKEFMGYTEKSLLKNSIGSLLSPVAEFVETLSSTNSLYEKGKKGENKEKEQKREEKERKDEKEKEEKTPNDEKGNKRKKTEPENMEGNSTVAERGDGTSEEVVAPIKVEPHGYHPRGATVEVALFKDYDPWGYTAIEDLLIAHGVSYDVYTSMAMGKVDLSKYDKVITASVQGDKFWSALELNRKWFEEYAYGGGILEMHLCAMPNSTSPGRIYPGGFVFYYETIQEVSIVYPKHPVLNDPNRISDEELDYWNWAAHGWFSKIPADSIEVLVATINRKPVFVDSKFGRGRIFATTQTVEWRAGHDYPEFLENMILLGMPVGPPSKDVLIIDDANKRAFFGWYRASQMPLTGWDLLQRTIDWADGFTKPSLTDIVLFTYDGTLDPVTDEDGYAVYEYLTGKGYVNIEVHFQGDAATLPASYYLDFDLVIYAWFYGYDCTNIVSSGVPFISFSASQTDEMGIGSGVNTMHEARHAFYVVDNGYYPTQTYPLGILTFESTMWTDATDAAGQGIPLVTVPVAGLCYDYTISMWIDPPPMGDWNVDHVIECNDTGITLNGDLSISGELRLNHVHLMMNVPDMETLPPYTIEVGGGGTFLVNSKDGLPSIIENGMNKSAYYTFQARKGSRFEMRNSELRYCGFAWEVPYYHWAGVWIATDGVIIENSLIENNHFVGLFFYNSSHHVISNNVIRSNAWYGIYGINSIDNQIDHNEITHNGQDGISLSSAPNSRITDNTINSNGQHGLQLSNAPNAIITNNNMSFNGWGGMALSGAPDSRVLFNTANSNRHDGIQLSTSPRSLIEGNTANSNHYCGIEVLSSTDTGILGNTANSNNHGIYVSNSRNATVVENTVISNRRTVRHSTGIYVSHSNSSLIGPNVVNSNWRGIYLEYTSHTSVNYNTVSGNTLFGIHLHESPLNMLSDNDVDGSTGEWDSAGVYLSHSEENELTRNLVDSSWHGMILWYSPNALITLNNVTRNNRKGISLEYSGASRIFENRAEHNGHGIRLEGSHNVNVTDNIADRNSVGISLWASHHVDVLLNTATENSDTGIYLSGSDWADILHNTASDNSYAGISLSSSHHTEIIDNSAERNKYGISLSSSSHNNITINRAKFNHFGISLRWSSNNNRVLENDVKSCIDYGAYLFRANTNLVQDNDFSNSDSVGIYLEQSHDNQIIRNNATSAQNYGINLFESNRTLIDQNDVTFSRDIGIELSSSHHNTMTLNTAERSDVGISIRFSTDNRVEDNMVVGNDIGIYLLRSSDNAILMNNANNNNNVGIDLSLSDSNEISGNSVNGNPNYGIHLYSSEMNIIENNDANMNGIGIYLDWSPNNAIVGNAVTHNQFAGIAIYWSSDHNEIVFNEAHSNLNISIRISSSMFNHVEGNNASLSAVGIFLDWSGNNVIINNVADSNAYHGISLDWFSDNNDVTGNSAVGGLIGISLDMSSHNTIAYNNASLNKIGISLEWTSNDNTIIHNTMCYNQYHGLSFHWESNENLVRNNTIGYNNKYGVYVYESSNNTIYHNDILYNIDQAFDNAVNYWNSSYPTGGNYWSDYTGVDLYSGPDQNVPGSDGIGDTPYDIDADSRDHYPLMRPMSVVVIASFYVKPSYFSPNGVRALREDTTTITAMFTDQPDVQPIRTTEVDWILRVKNDTGTVRYWRGTGEALDVEWDGTDETGEVVPDGEYYVLLQGRDKEGKPTRTESKLLVVDAIQPTITDVSDAPDPFDPSAGETTTISYTLSEKCHVTVKISDSAGRTIQTLRATQPAGPNSVTWDGKVQGLIVSDGTYTYEIHAVDMAGNEATPVTGTTTVAS